MRMQLPLELQDAIATIQGEFRLKLTGGEPHE